MATPYGYFEGQVANRWVNNHARNIRLLEDFAYHDKDGRVWLAPAGEVVNGASIPRFFWRFIGGPYSGKYRFASVVHDAACQRKLFTSKLAHRMFYEAMRDLR